MNRLLISLALTGAALSAVSHAQTLPALYQTYLRAGAKAQTFDQFFKSIDQVTRGLPRSPAAEMAARASICAVYVREYLALNPGRSATKLDLYDFTGTAAQLQTFCETQRDQALKRLPDEANAVRAMADISQSYLLTEAGMEGGSAAGKNDQQVAKLVNEVRVGLIGADFVTAAAQLDLLLQKYPAYLNRRLERSGSSPVGVGDDILGSAQDILGEVTPLFAEAAQDRQKDATAAVDKQQQVVIDAIAGAYASLQRLIAEGDAQMKAKDFEEAIRSYNGAQQAVRQYTYTQQSLLTMNINKQVKVGNKTMPFNDLVKATFALLATADKKEQAGYQAQGAATEALRAAWQSAGAKTLKGDKLVIFKQYGHPGLLTPSYRVGDNVNEAVAKMAAATQWTYGTWHASGGQSFTCNYSFTFKGNTLTGNRVFAEPANTDFQNYCAARYGR